MKKIVFLEGLPGVGKTTIINYLKDNYKVNVVDEIINTTACNNRTEFFLKNDDLKYGLKSGLYSLYSCIYFLK